jgi:hypothetical protein
MPAIDREVGIAFVRGKDRPYDALRLVRSFARVCVEEHVPAVLAHGNPIAEAVASLLLAFVLVQRLTQPACVGLFAEGYRDAPVLCHGVNAIGLIESPGVWYGGRLGEVKYTSRVRIERVRGPLRLAYLPAESEPVVFGVHDAVAEHYGVLPGGEAERATTLDYVVAAAAG